MGVKVEGTIGLSPPNSKPISSKREAKGYKLYSDNDFALYLAAQIKSTNLDGGKVDRGEAPEQALRRKGLVPGPAEASEAEPGRLSRGLEGALGDAGGLVEGSLVEGSGEDIYEGVMEPLGRNTVLNDTLICGWLKDVVAPLLVDTTLEIGLLSSLILENPPEPSQNIPQGTSPPLEVHPKFLGYFPVAVQVSGISKDHPAGQSTGQEVGGEVSFLIEDEQGKVLDFLLKVDAPKTDQVEVGKDKGDIAYLLGSGDGRESQGRVLQPSGLTGERWLFNSLTFELTPNPIEGSKGDTAHLGEGVAAEGSSIAGKKVLDPVEIQLQDGQGDVLLTFKPQVLTSGSVDTAGLSRVSNLEELISRLVAMARWQGHPGHYELELKLKPETLGKLRVHAVLVEDRLSLQLMVETSEAGRALQAALPELKQGLQTYGLKLEQVYVQVNTGQRGEEGREGQEKGLRWGAPVGPLLEVKNEEDTLPVTSTLNNRLNYLA